MIESLWPQYQDVERAGFIKGKALYELQAQHADGDLILLEENALPSEATATWHTHPRTGPNLSVMDYETFVSSGIDTHFIIASDEVRGYQVTTDGLVLNFGSLSRAQCSQSTFMEVFGIELELQSPILWT